MNIHMVQFNDTAKSYKTIARAKKELHNFGEQFEELYGDEPNFGMIRCGISARDDGRFVPFVLYSSIESIPGATTYTIHCNYGVCLLG